MDQVHQILGHLVGGGDDARAGLIAALIGDQLGELGGHIDGGAFERGTEDLPAATGLGYADGGSAGGAAGGEVVIADALERIRILDGREGELAFRLLVTVGEGSNDLTAILD